MSRFSHRSDDLEIMDDLNCSGEVVHQTLRELDYINQWLGGNSVTLNGLEKLFQGVNFQNKVYSIADIGCGSGDMLKRMDRKLKEKNISASLTGVDANPNIVAFARNTFRSNPELSFASENILSEAFRKKQFDVAVATLFLHHFTNDELVEILRSLKNQARVGIVINDLHRHWLAYYSIKILTMIFSKSTMVKFDAPLSVLRGFTHNEWVEILKKADIKNYVLTWKWAFRWQLIIIT